MKETFVKLHIHFDGELTEDEVQSLENPDIELETTESPSDDKASEATTEAESQCMDSVMV